MCEEKWKGGRVDSKYLEQMQLLVKLLEISHTIHKIPIDAGHIFSVMYYDYYCKI